MAGGCVHEEGPENESCVVPYRLGHARGLCRCHIVFPCRLEVSKDGPYFVHDIVPTVRPVILFLLFVGDEIGRGFMELADGISSLDRRSRMR